MFKRYAAITGAMLAAFALVGPAADAATAPVPHRSTGPAQVCTTGLRGQPAYDRACLTEGTPGDARSLWFDTAEGAPGAERDDMVTRRNICKFAPDHGGIMKWAAEFVGDMTHDTYRNDGQVNRWVGQDAALDCAQMGYPVSVVSVDLSTLPQGDCWYEVDRHNVEPICKR